MVLILKTSTHTQEADDDCVCMPPALQGVVYLQLSLLLNAAC